MWVHFITVAMYLFFGGYFNYNIKYMVEKRYGKYVTGDWPIGFAHMFTDVFFRFWYDYFRTVDNSQTLDNNHPEHFTQADIKIDKNLKNSKESFESVGRRSGDSNSRKDSDREVANGRN